MADGIGVERDMTHIEFHEILASLDALLPEQMQQLRRELDIKLSSSLTTGQTEGEPSEQELQRRLFQAGLLSEIKPPITDMAPYRNRKAVPIQGEPLSETVIRERR